MEIGLIILAIAVLAAALIVAFARPKAAVVPPPDPRLDTLLAKQGEIGGAFTQTVAAQGELARTLGERLEALEKRMGEGLAASTKQTGDTFVSISGLEFLDQIEMRHLSQGMDAGVRAAGAGDGDLLAGEFFDRGFQRALHRGAVALALPAEEGAAVIFNGQAVAHQASCVPAGTAKPFSKSSASIALPPARCTLRRRSAPLPQAMVRASSSVVPGAPLPFVGSA